MYVTQAKDNLSEMFYTLNHNIDLFCTFDLYSVDRFAVFLCSCFS